jgi:hypothetical protein
MKNLAYSFRGTFLLFMLAILFSTGCKKDLNGSVISNGSDGIQPFPLNWETTDYMPTPSGTTILVPWANGSVKGFSSDIWYDYKSNDGWALVYNVFNNNSLPANPWFALYNRYRGLLRVYVYVTNNGFVTSDYLTSGLNLSPNAISSSMLNYIGQDIVDVTKNQSVISHIEPTQLATGVWYASQYEIAYDSKIATSTYQQLGLNWTLKWTSISQISLGGTQQGTINGTITTPAPSFNLGNTLMNGALELTGLSVLQNNKGAASDFSQNTLGLPGNAFKAVQDGLQSGLSGVVKNVFSSIFGGSSSNTQQVSLTMNTNINLTGNSTQGGAFFPDPGLGIGIPGISNSQSAQGYIPGYNNPMGVFYLTSTPTVNVHTTTSIVYVDDGSGIQVPYTNYSNFYTVNNSILNSVFVANPNVINTLAGGAAIQNMQAQVVILNPDTGYDFQVWGNQETIGTNYNAYTGSSVTTSYSLEHGSQPAAQAAIRVIFDVVPNNGAPKSTIVKTFLANIVNN